MARAGKRCFWRSDFRIFCRTHFFKRLKAYIESRNRNSTLCHIIRVNVVKFILCCYDLLSPLLGLGVRTDMTLTEVDMNVAENKSGDKKLDAYIADALEVVELKFGEFTILFLDLTFANFSSFGREFGQRSWLCTRLCPPALRRFVSAADLLWLQWVLFSEKIVGYTNPKVSICYADASLFQYPQISYDEKVQETADIKVCTEQGYALPTRLPGR